MIDLLGLLQTAGVATGILGVMCSTLAIPRAWLCAFIFWVPSNICLMAWAHYSGQIPLVSLYGVYLFMALVGLWNHERKVGH